METRPAFEKFFDSKGWKYQWINAKGYDGILRVKDKEIKIETKMVREIWDSLFLELMQDTLTENIGWYYYSTAKYFFYGDKEKIHQIDMSRLREYVEEHGHRYETRLRNEERDKEQGWGTVRYKLIPWKLLEDKNIVKTHRI